VLTMDRIQEIINDVDFEKLEHELRMVKEESQNRERVILQQAWLYAETDMTFAKFYDMMAVSK